MNQVFYMGCCENRLDPLKLGRCQVRVVGLHIEDKTILPTEDLPWAYPMGAITSASISGLGWSPTGVVQGTWVIVIFLDEDQQQPIMIGTIGGIPQTKSAALVGESTNSIVTTDDDGLLTTAIGEDITDIIDAVTEVSNAGVTQETASKYHINAVNTQLSDGVYTTYTINDNVTLVTVATATFDKTTELYSVTLLKPELYTQEQYSPFKGTAKTFVDNKEILTYFDTNF
jgi:hypothetical protein